MSSPKTYRPPLIRQVLPWFFVLVFLITAPLLIFYTSGYRYNFKKGLIERNGTLIIDSTPEGAELFVDDRPTNEQTPITLQNMVPGWHTIRVEKPGYASWQESVLIRPERVTFANQIWLWRTEAPTLVWSGQVRHLTADPLREHAVLISESDGSSRWTIWQPGNGKSSLPFSGRATSTSLRTVWSTDGRAILMDHASPARAWWIHVTKGQEILEPLPQGHYHWSDTELIGNNETNEVRLDRRKLTFTSTPHKPFVLESSQGLELHSSPSSTENRILIDDSFLTRRFVLPAGNWSFGDIHRPFVLFQDEDRWLAVQIKFGQPYAETLRGDYPRWSPHEDLPQALFLHGNEVWLWTMGNAPTLLWRESGPLRQVAWHRSSKQIFIANQTSVFALSLEEHRGGLVTPLASFDSIADLTIIGRALYVAGTRNNQSGIWELTVE